MSSHGDMGRRRGGTVLDVTVAVSTYGRASLLPRLLEALDRQTLPPDRFEVVVVDDGSSDDTPLVLDRMAAIVSYDLHVLRQPNQGAAAGRNRAWRAGRAPIVAFTDDDCRPAPGWLEAGVAAVEAGAAIAIGHTEPDPEELGLLDHPYSRTLVMEDARFFQTANAFYRRDLLEAVSGFDESFTTGEDTDLGLRAQAAGGRATYVPAAVVHHRVATSDLTGAIRGALRWRDLPLVVKRHPEMRRELWRRCFWKRSHPPALGAAGAGVALVTGRTRWSLLLAVPWLWLRLHRQPVTRSRARRVTSLPGVLVVDLAEVAAMATGSLRHRVLVL